MPVVSTLQLSSDTAHLIFIGSNFFTAANYAATAYYLGAASTSSSIIDATQVSASFPSGLPVSNTVIAPQLLFTDTSTGIGHFAAITTTIANAFTVSSSSSSAVSCSFAGGCTLSMNINGLSSSMQSGLASVAVCGQPCTF